ncbi:hypothetical protein [Trebonia sp.]|uniref:hypothetical protein n=1 Tax=Trebonia sp. TaxID=2767075 RepID=UPI0026181F54|nr:hypothetical protein [Trebonia sp.]
MIALLRYQAAILLRSHRWIFPLIAYGALIAVGAAGSTPLAEGLDWGAAMLVPVVAFVTRSMLTAEPDAARACAAAAAGPVRAQLAALLTALGAGVVLAIGGACVEVLSSETASNVNPPPAGVGVKITALAGHPAILAAGLATAAVCLLVGSAVGALCNPPLLRHPGAAMLATLAVAVFALASGVSPAGAALRESSAAQSQPRAAHWPGGVPLAAAACLLAVTWTASTYAAARRESRSPGAA